MRGNGMWMEMERRHREKVARKYEKIQMLKVLVEVWEERGDFDYVRELRARLRTAIANLESMRPLKDE